MSRFRGSAEQDAEGAATFLAVLFIGAAVAVLAAELMC